MAKNKALIFADNLVLPKGLVEKGPFYVLANRGKIDSITRADSGECDDCDRCDAITCHLLAPGFVDIHNHGIGGEHDVLDYWLKPDYTCSKAVLSGTTSILASVVFPQNAKEMDNVVLDVLGSHVGRKDIGAVIEGIHAEGPLITDFAGLPKSNTEWTETEFENLTQKIPKLKVMTVSPSKASTLNYQAIKMLHEKGVVAALGHDKQATEQQIIDALSTSNTHPCHITHMFNVSTFGHRNPGLVNFGLLDHLPLLAQYENVVLPTIEMVGDMVHVHPLAVQLALSSRSWDQIAFVTDCIAEQKGQEQRTYCGRKLMVHGNEAKVVKCCDDGTIVGSCITMLDIFRNLTNDLDVPVGKAIMMLSENPARIAKLQNVGTLEVGKDANFIMFDSNYNLVKTFVDGRMVFRRSACGRKRIVSTESFDESFEA